MFPASRGLFQCLMRRHAPGYKRYIVIPQHLIDQRQSKSSNLLTHRFNEYIGKQIPQLNSINSDKKLNLHKLHQDSSDLSQLPHEQLLNLISQDVLRSNDTSSLLTALDMECLRRIPALDQHQLLHLMHAFHQIIPTRLNRLNCYVPAMSRICETYESHQPPGDFVKICHYLGVAKKNGPSAQLLDAFVRRHFNKYLERVTLMDLAIVATATFRAAVPLQLNQAKRFEKAILTMDEETSNIDWPLLNAFIKTLRLSRVHSDRSIRCLIEWMRNGRLDSIEFRGLAHMFVYFADNRIADATAMQWFCSQAMRRIEAVSPEMLDNRRGDKSDMRAKDFRLFLWCLAHLNANKFLNDLDMDKIGRIVLAKFRNDEFHNEDDLVDLMMSLWQLRIASQTLFDAIFQGYRPEPPAEKIRVKLHGRKNLLLFCVELEKPEWLDAVGIPRTKEQVFRIDRKANKKFTKHSIELNRVYEMVCREFPDNQVDIVCPIKELNIPGIGLRSAGKNVRFIEVLESHTVLSDGKSPFGMLQLKMKLLQDLGFQVDLVSAKLWKL